MSKKEIIAVNYCISYLIVHWWYLYVQLLLENYFFMTYAAKFEVHAMILTLTFQYLEMLIHFTLKIFIIKKLIK